MGTEEAVSTQGGKSKSSKVLSIVGLRRDEPGTEILDCVRGLKFLVKIRLSLKFTHRNIGSKPPACIESSSL